MSFVSKSVDDWCEGFFAAVDGTRLYYRVYRPAAPRRTLIILHGFGEHSYRYHKFSHYFSDMQIGLYDMRGMGLSGGVRADILHFDQFEQDALSFVGFLNREFPSSAPQIWLGHSLGGLNLLRLCQKNCITAERLIFSAPCIRVAVPGFLLALNQCLAAHWPQLRYHNPVYFRNLTHDPAELLSYKKDRLITREMTARLLSEMVRAGADIERAHTIALSAPAHFLLAGDDKIVRTAPAQRIYEKISAPHKTIQIYKGFYHEIFNELDQAQVFKDLAQILL